MTKTKKEYKPAMSPAEFAKKAGEIDDQEASLLQGAENDKAMKAQDKKTRQKDLENQDVKGEGIKTDDPRIVTHLGWSSPHLVIRTTREGLEAAEAKEPDECRAWLMSHLKIVDGNVTTKQIDAEVKELYKTIFVE